MAFSAEWLRLREPADHAARSAAITATITPLVDRAPHTRPLVDLATGTGSNVRHLLPHLAGGQHWHLLDADARLLDALEPEMRAWSQAHQASVDRDGTAIAISHTGARHRLIAQHCDLSAGDIELASARLVTASALLDLVSRQWLERLTDQCVRASAVALFALSYDGRISCAPQDDADEAVRLLVNQHQLGDKGFGAALGPAASAVAEACFQARGYATRRARSDWSLGTADAALQRALIDGWAAAARELAGSGSASARVDETAIDDSAIERWRVRRQAHITSGASHIVVGPEDLAAWPAGETGRPAELAR
jgi:hypothetical protein